MIEPRLLPDSRVSTDQQVPILRAFVSLWLNDLDHQGTKTQRKPDRICRPVNLREIFFSSIDQMLKLHERLAATKPGHERDAGVRRSVIQRQIDATDAQIDRLVYDLYGLTDEEIRLVEEATA